MKNENFLNDTHKSNYIELSNSESFLGNIKFKNEMHKENYIYLCALCRRLNEEVSPVMYLLSLFPEDYLSCNSAMSDIGFHKICDCFDFNLMHIKPSGIKQAWQYSGSVKATRLAFCLWNGFPTERPQKNNNVYNIFGSGFDMYFLQAIALRFTGGVL